MNGTLRPNPWMLKMVHNRTKGAQSTTVDLGPGEACILLSGMRVALLRDVDQLWARARSISFTVTAAERAACKAKAGLLERHAKALEMAHAALTNRAESAAPTAGS